jgi:hypothetical protein
VGKSEGKKSLETPRHRDNVKIVLRDIGWVGVDWINLAYNGRLL